MATIDVDHLPVADVHIHPFLNQGAITAEEFTDLSAFGGGDRAYMEEAASPGPTRSPPMSQRGKRNALYFKRMVLDLSRFFDVEPTLDAVLAARNAAVEQDYSGYVSRLYGDAGLDTFVCDFGIPLPMLDIARCAPSCRSKSSPSFASSRSSPTCSRPTSAGPSSAAATTTPSTMP